MQAWHSDPSLCSGAVISPHTLQFLNEVRRRRATSEIHRHISDCGRLAPTIRDHPEKTLGSVGPIHRISGIVTRQLASLQPTKTMRCPSLTSAANQRNEDSKGEADLRSGDSSIRGGGECAHTRLATDPGVSGSENRLALSRVRTTSSSLCTRPAYNSTVRLRLC